MITSTQENGCLTLTLNRPDKANALTGDMLGALCEAIEGAQEARVLVLTGEGKVFSAGADLEAARAGLATSPLWERLSSAVAGFGGLSIAALNGSCAGGAMGMILACDLRLSVPDARFFYPVMRLGFLPQPSDPARLTALVGPSRAKMVLMAGHKVPAQEALAWGLVDQVVGAEALAATVESLSQDCRNADAAHVTGIKSMIPV